MNIKEKPQKLKYRNRTHETNKILELQKTPVRFAFINRNESHRRVAYKWTGKCLTHNTKGFQPALDHVNAERMG